MAAGTQFRDGITYAGRLDFSAEPVIIADCIHFQQAAGAHYPCEGSNAGRRLFFDVPTPFEVPRKSRGKTRYSAAWDKRKSNQNQIKREQHSKNKAAKKQKHSSVIAKTKQQNSSIIAKTKQRFSGKNAVQPPAGRITASG
ncbi:hypothetical protein ES707_10344 [subsurface metagenome]